MLFQYLQTSRRLLLNDQTFVKVNEFDLRDWVNIARNQLAGETECVRAQASLATVANQQVYPFSAITIPGAGYQGAVAVRLGFVGSARLDFRSFEWFSEFYWNSGNVGQPARMAQQGQGAAGTLYFDPVPNAVFVVSLDIAALPMPLVDDTTTEVIPKVWTDAIPYYAAYMGFLQQGDKDSAQTMMQLYEQFVIRGRVAATSSVLPDYQPDGVAAKQSVPPSRQPLQGRAV
jgi:hypothetical protein